MPVRLLLAALFAAAVFHSSLRAEMPKIYVQGDALAGPLTVSHSQKGGFAGLIETQVAIDASGMWKGQRKVGGRANTGEGKLTSDQLKALAAALEKLDMLGLPQTVGASKPVKPPRNVADGASTSIKLTFGKKQVVANFADGVATDEKTSKLRRRLAQIESAIRRATIDAPKKR